MFVQDSIEYLESCREESGNEYIDVRTSVPEKRAKNIVSGFRAEGIKRFTYSAISEGAIRTALVFQECGCELEGLVKIDDFAGHEIPAYLFKVN